MSSKAREQIAKLICNLANDAGECESCKKHKGCPDSWDDVREKVDSVIAKFEEWGYRPRPQLTLISPEEIKNKVEEAFKEDDLLRHYVESRGHWEDIAPAIAQAQLDHDREG